MYNGFLKVVCTLNFYSLILKRKTHWWTISLQNENIFFGSEVIRAFLIFYITPWFFKLWHHKHTTIFGMYKNMNNFKNIHLYPFKFCTELNKNFCHKIKSLMQLFYKDWWLVTRTFLSSFWFCIFSIIEIFEK